MTTRQTAGETTTQRTESSVSDSPTYIVVRTDDSGNMDAWDRSDEPVVGRFDDVIDARYAAATDPQPCMVVKQVGLEYVGYDWGADGRFSATPEAAVAAACDHDEPTGDDAVDAVNQQDYEEACDEALYGF